MPRIQLGGAAADPSALQAGETTVPRWGVGSAAVLSSGNMRLAYLTATKTEVIGNVRIAVGGTAAGATPTLCRMGVYAVDANGDLTLVGATANDTTLFSAASVAVTRALTTPFTKVAGQRYAVGVLVVSAAAMPNICHPATSSGFATELGAAPRLSGSVNSLADLSATVSAGLVNTSAFAIYAALLP